jgi:hypothetical protein
LNNHRKGRWNTYGSYSFLHRNNFEENVFDRQVQGSRFVQSNYAPSFINSHNYRFGIDFYADKMNTLGILFRGFGREGEIITNNNTQQTRVSDGRLLSEFQTVTTQTFQRTNLAGNTNWKHSFDTTGRELNVDIDYSTFQLDNRSSILITQSSGAKSINEQIVENPVKFGVLKIDYSHPLNKNAKWEAGIKASDAQINNYLTFKRAGTIDPNTTNDFLYKENINAAYLTYQTKLDGWEFTGGLRAEQTIAKGSSAGVKNLDRNYVQYFPSAFLTRSVTKDISAVVQYSKRVTRPSYQQQNPFVEFIDSLTYSKGNPSIKPEITHASKLSLTYQSQPFFGISYNVTNDVIFENAPRQQGFLAYATPENLGQFRNVAIELNFPIKFGKKVSGFGGNQAVYNHYKADYLGDTYDKARWNWLAYWQVSYKPAATLSVETSGFYMTKALEEFLTIKPLGNLNLAIQKTFWENKGRLTLNLSDVFYSNRATADIVYQEIAVRFAQRNETRNVRLAFNYSFGNQKLKAARSRTTASDTETNRVKTN